MSIKITKLAEDKLDLALANQDESFFVKIAALSGGCSGFKYYLGLDQKQDQDIFLQTESGRTILVSAESAPLLEGVVLDYRQDLFSEGFFFSNPNAHSCGCGSSFRPKDSEECDIE